MGSSKREWKHIKDAPDWPALRKTLAEQAGKSESEIQELAEGWDSLDEVELVMPIEEAFGIEIHL
jgi:acyl carrier protein